MIHIPLDSYIVLRNPYLVLRDSAHLRSFPLPQAMYRVDNVDPIKLWAQLQCCGYSFHPGV